MLSQIHCDVEAPSVASFLAAASNIPRNFCISFGVAKRVRVNHVSAQRNVVFGQDAGNAL